LYNLVTDIFNIGSHYVTGYSVGLLSGMRKNGSGDGQKSDVIEAA